LYWVKEKAAAESPVILRRSRANENWDDARILIEGCSVANMKFIRFRCITME